MATFSLNAWITGTRWRHSRAHDHYGMDTDNFVGISQQIGPYEAGTTVHFVLQDLFDRLVSLESSTKVISLFSLEAYIWPLYGLLDAVLQAPADDSFTFDAWLNQGGSIGLDAVIFSQPSFGLFAFII